MCGIFGVIARETIPPPWIEALGQLNSIRGNSAFGGLVWSPKHPKAFRFPGPFDADKIELNAAKVFLGHIRAPTGGRTTNLNEIHPFETSSFLLAHNGLLLNHHKFPDWKIDQTRDVDSQMIIGGIQRFFQDGRSVQHAITETVQRLDGQQACWLWHKTEPMIYLWRVMSTLFYSHQPDYFVFSSIKGDLTPQRLPEGAVYQLDPRTIQFMEAGSFEYYNPYQLELD
jgi:glutamine phosphoribosylpyrophosphate amidotransferase